MGRGFTPDESLPPQGAFYFVGTGVLDGPLKPSPAGEGGPLAVDEVSEIVYLKEIPTPCVALRVRLRFTPLRMTHYYRLYCESNI